MLTTGLGFGLPQNRREQLALICNDLDSGFWPTKSKKREDLSSKQ
jgi:hypothetical protein